GPVTETAAVAVFALLGVRAGNILVGTALPGLRSSGRRFALGVLVPCIALLPIARVQETSPLEPWLVLPVGLGLLVIHWLNLAPVLLHLGRRGNLHGRDASGLLLLLGTGTFALAGALGFVVYRSADGVEALRWLSVPLALAAAAVLAGGGLLHHK